MIDPHYDGGHKLALAEYYNGLGDGRHFNRESRMLSDSMCPPRPNYNAGWKEGYEDTGRSMEKAVDKILEPKKSLSIGFLNHKNTVTVSPNES